jgi:hypothetical protein
MRVPGLLVVVLLLLLLLPPLLNASTQTQCCTAAFLPAFPQELNLRTSTAPGQNPSFSRLESTAAPA